LDESIERRFLKRIQEFQKNNAGKSAESPS